MASDSALEEEHNCMALERIRRNDPTCGRPLRETRFRRADRVEPAEGVAAAGERSAVPR